MKLNNRGYLLVEIIVASVLAMTLMYFLVEITINLKNINEDYYVETKLETDQILMIRDVMNDISNNTLVSVTTTGNIVDFSFKDSNENEFKTRITIDNNTFKYGKINSSNNYDNSVYINTFDKNLDVKSLTIDNLCYTNNQYKKCSQVDVNTINKGLLQIKIPASTIFDENDYGLNLSIPYSYKKVTIKESVNYFYYSSHTRDRDGKNIVNIYACNADNCNDSNCSCNEAKYNNNPSNFLLFSKGNYGFTIDPQIAANNKNLYYTDFYSSYNTDPYMSIYKCDVDGNNCQKIITNIAVAPVNSEINSQMLVNDKYLYYTSYSSGYSSSNYDHYMNINRCDLDGTNCQRIGASANEQRARALITSNETPQVATGGSIMPYLAINDKYLYYTSYYYERFSDYYYETIYMCNIDGTNCHILGNSNDGRTSRIIIGKSNNHYQTQITATDDNFYYTSWNGNRDDSYMGIYKCKPDGTNCTFLINSEVGSMSRAGGAFNTQISANKSNLYYTSFYYSYNNGAYMEVYACSPSGTNCMQVNSSKVCYNEGYSSLNPRISANNNNFYYTSCYSERNGGTYMRVNKCNIDGTNCKYLKSGDATCSFSDCGSSGLSTTCWNLAFAKQNPLIVANNS